MTNYRISHEDEKMPRTKTKIDHCVTGSTAAVTTTAYVTGDDLAVMLGLPKNATIVVEVPSGGDYSGCELELTNADRGLKIRWAEIVTDGELV